jgi:non-ribosomal peptide synthetase component F
VKPHRRELAAVGICVEREPELVVAVLRVLKAGGAYLPRDPGYPPDRPPDMVQDCAPGVVLTYGWPAGRLAGLTSPPAGRRGGRVTAFAAPARPHPLRKDSP